MKIKHYIIILIAIVATPIIVNFILYSNPLVELKS